MNKNALQEGIRKLGPWFHKIDFPGGLTTKTESTSGEDDDHPLQTWSHVKPVLPADLAGRTVLDVGCNGGFYSIEANRRGATVLGVDAKRWLVRQARFAAQALDLKHIRFEQASLYALNPRKQGTFDVVLALGLIYHLKHLVHGLEILFDMCDDLLILETVVSDDIAADPVTDVSGQSLFPLRYVKNDPTKDEAAFNWFVPSSRTVKAMLEDVGFGEVAVEAVFHDRCILSARKQSGYLDSRYPAFTGGALRSGNSRITGHSGSIHNLEVTAENTGRGRWLKDGVGPEGTGAVGLFLYLTSEEDPVFGRDFPRQKLERDIEPGESLKWTIPIPLPEKPGLYELEIDLVSEHVTLFQDTGNDPLRVAIEVEP